MRCPICGDELKLSRKNPGYALCHSCRKKFKLPKNIKSETAKADTETPKASTPVLDDELTDQTQVFSRREVRAALKKANADRKAEKAAERAAAKNVSRASSKKVNSADTLPEENDDDVEYHFRYANIPPKEVREKQEREMRKAYDELLSIGKEERSSKKRGLFGRKK